MLSKCINVLSMCLIYQLTRVACQNPSTIDPKGDIYSGVYNNQLMPQPQRQIPYYPSPSIYQYPVYPSNYYQDYYHPMNNDKLNTKVINQDDYHQDDSSSSSNRNFIMKKQQSIPSDYVQTINTPGLLQRLLTRRLNREKEATVKNESENEKAYVY